MSTVTDIATRRPAATMTSHEQLQCSVRGSMKLRKYTKRKSATGKPYPQCQHVTDGKQCEKPVYAEHRCWEHQQKSEDSVLGAKAIRTRSRPAEGIGASADDPFGCLNCTHAECGRFYDHNARRMHCRAMADNACAR